MSCGATVGASAAYSNVMKLNIFTPVLNKFYVHCNFSKWFIEYLNSANKFNQFVCLLLLIFSIHISGPATVQNQNLWSAYMYIYCHVVNF